MSGGSLVDRVLLEKNDGDRCGFVTSSGALDTTLQVRQQQQPRWPKYPPAPTAPGWPAWPSWPSRER
jgi:hypothetical protein